MSDLFKAIIAMDAYNRGYNSGLDLNDRDVNGNPIVGSSEAVDKKIGDWTIIANSTLAFQNDAAQNIGFYGIAYEYNGEVIIAYRGTDDVFGDGVGGISNKWSSLDIWNG